MTQRPKYITFTMDAADADGIVDGATSTAAATLSATGVLVSGGVATLDVARRVSVTATWNASALNFTINGTNRYGQTLATTIAGPNTTTGYTTANFKTVSSVTVDAAATAAIDVGSSNKAATQWYLLDTSSGGETNLMTSVAMSSGAAMEASMQYTLSNLWATSVLEQDAVAFNATGISAASSVTLNLTQPMVAVRMSFASYSTGSCFVTFLPAGYR